MVIFNLIKAIYENFELFNLIMSNYETPSMHWSITQFPWTLNWSLTQFQVRNPWRP